MRLYRQPAAPEDKLSDTLAAKFESDASRYWDMFYKRNATKFFKDRHYFDKEFPELLDGQLTVLEVGCGVGNTVFPLLEINPQLRVYACDFSPRAVQLVQEHAAYGSGRVTAFVADITTDPLLPHLPGSCVDYCSMVFVLSAIAPEKMSQAIRNVASVSKPGAGRILFRDYAAGDLAQARLEDGNGVKFIRDKFYVRGDGTCCYYYSEDGLRALFASQGYVCESMVIHTKTIENRKLDVKMPRRWIQAVFRWAPEEVSTAVRDAAREQWLQQNPQQSADPPPDKKQRRELPSASASKAVPEANGHNCSGGQGTIGIVCCGRSWTLPAETAGDNSNVQQLQLVAAELEQLLHAQQQAQLQQEHPNEPQKLQQQLPVLSQQYLILPPWAAVQQQQQQPRGVVKQHEQDGNVQRSEQHPTEHVGGSQCQQLQQQQQSSWFQASVLTDCIPDLVPQASHSSCSVFDSSATYLHGIAVALFALIVVWLGARRVYVLVPGQGPYGAGFTSMLRMNESRVVCERVRQRKCDVGDKRQLQKLRRELAGQQIGVVVGRPAATYDCAVIAAEPSGCLETLQQLQSMLQRSSSTYHSIKALQYTSMYSAQPASWIRPACLVIDLKGQCRVNVP